MLHHWRAVAGDRRELRLKGHILLELLGRGELEGKMCPVHNVPHCTQQEAGPFQLVDPARALPPISGGPVKPWVGNSFPA